MATKILKSTFTVGKITPSIVGDPTNGTSHIVEIIHHCPVRGARTTSSGFWQAARGA